MARVRIPAIGGTDKGSIVSVNHQEAINLVQVSKKYGAKSQLVLESAPGLENISVGSPIKSDLNTPIMLTGNPNPVSGGGVDAVYTVIYNSFGRSAIGGVFFLPVWELDEPVYGSGFGRDHVVMAISRGQIAFVDGLHIYVYSEAPGGIIKAKSTRPTYAGDFDPPPGRPTHIISMDGFFIVNDVNSENFYISQKGDARVWNALEFEASSVKPDKALALANTESLLWVFGERSIQAFYNSGNSDFPYSVVLSATQNVGLLASYSVVSSSSGIFFLGESPEGGVFVGRIQGQQMTVITESEQANMIDQVADKKWSWGFCFTIGDEAYYVLQLGRVFDPPDPASTVDEAIGKYSPVLTMVYSISTNSWTTFQASDGSIWDVGSHGFYDRDNLMGAARTNQYFKARKDIYEYAGDPIVRTRTTQVFHNNSQQLDWHEFLIDYDIGPGDGGGNVIELRYSDNNGETWAAWQSQLVGRLAERGKRRTIFRALGAGYDRTWQIRYSGNTPFTLIDCYADVEPLDD